jgi:hypothetical protein
MYARNFQWAMPSFGAGFSQPAAKRLPLTLALPLNLV